MADILCLADALEDEQRQRQQQQQRDIDSVSVVEYSRWHLPGRGSHDLPVWLLWHRLPLMVR